MQNFRVTELVLDLLEVFWFAAKVSVQLHFDEWFWFQRRQGRTTAGKR